ncbi:MAG TPA: hypothetical protein VGA40_08780 [Candidatus Acidoferrales bacterium]
MRPRLRKLSVLPLMALSVVVLQFALADGGAIHQSPQSGAIQLGTSGGNVNDISSAFCCSGTLGALVTKDDTQYILSNNHVLAKSNTGTFGDPISQPGLIDVGCNAGNTRTVATLSEFAPLGPSNVDAAIAAVVPGTVDPNGAILDIGSINPNPVNIDAGVLNLTVAKSGRTTGLTCANISSISTDVQVQYQEGCNSGKKFKVTYQDQIVVSGSSFSAGGDSGSLIVTAGTVQPIALLYAGSSSATIGNRISDVTSELGISFVGDGSGHVTCPDGNGGGGGGGGGRPPGKGKSERSLPPQAVAGFERAQLAKQRHAARLMADDAVLGVGVGVDADNGGEAVVVIYVEEGRAHGQIPAALDGVSTRIVRTDAFRAFGWNEQEPRGCPVR